ncbi:11072_t:CDS:2 [Diversispora eburnea]|uniref:Protein YOP1 n=1 Tax=Diversispora eburnea TaxID=1213867 RepID=A0A9N8VHZ5_9GLOM|nr:11072_t:CDS:2 [Diversispora eburnea]
MEAVQTKLKYYNAQADKELAKYPQIMKLEQHTGIPKTYMAASVVGLVFALIFFNIGGQLLSNVIGWVYPAYASFKALETSDNIDDTQWLTYWTVFGFVSLIEFFSDLILYWMPFYYTVKTIFFLWLFLPSFKGAQTVYTKFLRPALRTYQGDIDDKLKGWKNKVETVTKDAIVNAATHDD